MNLKSFVVLVLSETVVKMRISNLWIFLSLTVVSINSVNIEEKKANLVKDLKNDKTELFSGSRERRYPGGYGYNGYGNNNNGYGQRPNSPYGYYGNNGGYGGYQRNPYNQYYPYYTTVGFPFNLFTTTPPVPFPFYYFTTPPPFPLNLFGKKKK